ncbi:MAG: 3'-5' exonuclease [Rhodospirillaceae bacterium]
MPAIMDTPARRSGISREQIADLPLRRYEGEVRLVETAADIELAMADMTAETVVGFDTETRPAFRRGEVYLPALVQAATAQRVYLFQLRHTAVHDAVAQLLGSPRVVKAGVAVAHDLRTLKGVFPFEPRNVVDLGVLARRRGMEQTGLRNLAGLLLGYRIPKGAKTTNWAAHRLSDAQVAYAATDAWACRELYLRFATLGLIEDV